MAEFQKVTILVERAAYIEDADSILLLGSYKGNKIRHQVHSSSFTFGDKNKKEEMEKLADLMVGKKINIVYDPDLEGKIKDNFPLKY